MTVDYSLSLYTYIQYIYIYIYANVDHHRIFSIVPRQESKELEVPRGTHGFS